jgi:hypothetical protein
MALLECRSAEDVRERAKRQYEWHRQQYAVKHCETAPIVEPTPVVQSEPEPIAPEPIVEPFIPPAPVVVAHTFVLNGAAYARSPTIGQIIDLVCAAFKVSKGDLLSDRRTQDIVVPRQVVMYLARTCTKQSLPFIGKHLGGRDHTTILSGLKKIDRLRARDPSFESLLDELSTTLRQPT